MAVCFRLFVTDKNGTAEKVALLRESWFTQPNWCGTGALAGPTFDWLLDLGFMQAADFFNSPIPAHVIAGRVPAGQ